MTFWQVIQHSWGPLMDGLQVTIQLTLLSIVFGLALGLILALGKVYGVKPIRWLCTAFIEVIRGTPLLVQIFIFYFGLPPYGIRLSPLEAAVLAFSVNSGAYQAEYLRGAIQSIPSGQMQAALSMGMTRWQGIISIIMPQALRRVIPPWTNEFIYLLKYTSLAYIIGTQEIMAQARFVASRNYEYFQTYLFAALIYLVVVLVFSELFSWLERRVRIPGFEHHK